MLKWKLNIRPEEGKCRFSKFDLSQDLNGPVNRWGDNHQYHVLYDIKYKTSRAHIAEYETCSHAQGTDFSPVNYGLSSQVYRCCCFPRPALCPTANYLIRDNSRLSSFPPFTSHVCMTSHLNGLLCCVITQAREASKYKQIWEGFLRTGKECSSLLCKASRALGK